LLVVVKPVAKTVVRSDGVVAHQRLREAGQQRLGVDIALEVGAQGADDFLELQEVLDMRNMFSTARAALGGFPGSVPFKRAVNLPVREHKARRDSLFAVGVGKIPDAFPDGGAAEVEREGTAHVLCAERVVPEGLAVRADMGGAGIAIEKGVEAGGRVYVNAQPEL